MMLIESSIGPSDQGIGHSYCHIALWLDTVIVVPFIYVVMISTCFMSTFHSHQAVILAVTKVFIPIFPTYSDQQNNLGNNFDMTFWLRIVSTLCTFL